MTTTPHAQIVEENCESCKAITQGSQRASAIRKLKQERSGLMDQHATQLSQTRTDPDSRES